MSGPRESSGTILLVDDNPLRASMRTSLLEGGAPAVVRALDAAEALCMVEAQGFPGGLSLVITGHVMTGISGPEFVAEIRSRVPHVPVLVLSAFLDAEKQYVGIPGVVVSRTTSAEELRSLVSRMIASNGSIGSIESIRSEDSESEHQTARSA